MKVLEKNCMHTKVSVNNSKTKTMLVTSKKKTCVMYNNEPLDCVESFKYLGIEVFSHYRWNECVTRHLEVGKRACYAFKNTCNHEIVSVGSS